MMLIAPFLLLFLAYQNVVASDAHSEPTETECNSDSEWIQPIAINLGLDAITAAYAHSDTNISVLAVFSIHNQAVNLTSYQHTIQHLRKQHVKEYKDPPAKSPRIIHLARGFLEDIKVVTDVLSEMALQYWSEIVLPTLDDSNELYWYPVWFFARAATYGCSQFSRFLSFVTERINPTEDRLSLDYIEAGFVQALKTAREVAYINTGINITSAMIIYPDYLDTAVQGRIYNAAYDAGFNHLALGTHTERQIAERFGNTLLFNKTYSPDQESIYDQTWVDDQPNLILLQQGAAHFDILTSGRHCLVNHPQDGLGCEAIIRSLMFEFSKSNPDVKEEIITSNSLLRLRREIITARETLTNQRRESIPGETDSEQPQEWPLDLDSWWSSEDKKRPVSLRWEEIEAVNTLYADVLAESLDQVLLCLQGATSTPDPASSKSVDGVVILGSYCDGSLLQRAIKKSMGEHVHIFGGADGWYVTYIAELGARAALRTRQRISRAMEAECQMRAEYFHDLEDEDKYWGEDPHGQSDEDAEHDEL
ncbi:hypothetical protein BJY04DRAFT_3736 [Aspergillus karnatakaensis]|uniref:uncharacterized protein n=1 Tax=Aspergillus karnatakaensis TaxID=1810916 RepID=UPI003CCE4ACF